VARRKHKIYGVCRICGKYKKLSDDHVPPQGGVKIESVEIKKAFDIFSKQIGENKYFISQNGVKFTTLCECCNSRLGREFDTTLNLFSKDICKFLNSKLELLGSYSISTKPNKLIRAVLGHLLASNVTDEISEFDEKVREFLFDETKPIPDDINVFYWIYPYKLTIIIRDILMSAVRGKYDDFGIFQILKYYPIGFLVTNKTSYQNLSSLSIFNSISPNEVRNINIRINELKHWKWPEKIDNGNAILIGETGSKGIKANKHNINKHV